MSKQYTITGNYMNNLLYHSIKHCGVAFNVRDTYSIPNKSEKPRFQTSSFSFTFFDCESQSCKARECAFCTPWLLCSKLQSATNIKDTGQFQQFNIKSLHCSLRHTIQKQELFALGMPSMLQDIINGVKIMNTICELSVFMYCIQHVYNNLITFAQHDIVSWLGFHQC